MVVLMTDPDDMLVIAFQYRPSTSLQLKQSAFQNPARPSAGLLDS
jgi:hypothetical protein